MDWLITACDYLAHSIWNVNEFFIFYFLQKGIIYLKPQAENNILPL
jgi:hypothetical protein